MYALYIPDHGAISGWTCCWSFSITSEVRLFPPSFQVEAHCLMNGKGSDSVRVSMCVGMTIALVSTREWYSRAELPQPRLTYSSKVKYVRLGLCSIGRRKLERHSHICPHIAQLSSLHPRTARECLAARAGLRKSRLQPAKRLSDPTTETYQFQTTQ